MLDQERLNHYAQKAAEALNQYGPFFDGYADEARTKEGIFGRLRQSLLAPAADKTELDCQHIGYGVLEESQELGGILY